MTITKKAENFYQEVVLRLKAPENITMLLVLLIVCKLFFPIHFGKLITILKNNIPHLAFAIEMLLIFTIILSVMSLLSAILILCYKPIVNKKYFQISDTEIALLYIGDYYKLNYGAQRKLLEILTWFCIFAGYLYILEESRAIYFVNLFAEMIINSQGILFRLAESVLIAIYGVGIILALVNLFKNMVYHFFYPRYEKYDVQRNVEKNDAA
ncbi:hypothetical protein [Brevibacillus sp. BC25]|uniref:hypothetical protein n=1 Tax=Brevibacillus sp. BC25 TaxID=1144308 RepID=UPI000271036B|nr:hypothetical protein [Brevibacillus sp. BC25]EJL31403.1 hypothetical protein PMI05_00766 [Brevibacillus sp. BC25]